MILTKNISDTLRHKLSKNASIYPDLETGKDNYNHHRVIPTVMPAEKWFFMCDALVKDKNNEGQE